MVGPAARRRGRLDGPAGRQEVASLVREAEAAAELGDHRWRSLAGDLRELPPLVG